MIAAGAPSWAVWLAVGLGVLNVVVWACVVVGVRRLVAQYKQAYGPMIAPLLAMFAPAETSGNASASVVTRLDVDA